MAILIFSNSFAQTKEVEELESRLINLKGVDRVDVLNSLSTLLKRSSFDKSKTYAEEALKLSREIEDNNGEAKALANIGFAEYTQNNLEKAERLYLSALVIFQDSNNDIETARTHNQIGLIYWRRNQFISAFKSYREAQKIADKAGAKELSAEALNYMGLIYWKWSDYNKAIDYFFNALKIKEALGDKFEIGLTLNNIAFLYNEMDQVEQSIVYSNKVMDLVKELKDNYVLGRVLNNLGVSYYKRKEFQKAAYYQKESLRIKEEAGDKSGMAYSYNDLGNIFLAEKKYDEALNQFNHSLEIRTQLKDKFGIATVLFSIAKTQKQKGNATLAHNSFYTVLDTAIAINNKRLEANIYKELADLNRVAGNNDLAFKYLNKYSSIIDSVLSKESRDKILELSVIYDVNSKDNELKIKNLEIEREQTKIYLGYFIFISFLIAIVVLHTRYTSVKKVKHELEKTNKDLQEKSKTLEETIKTRDRFFSIFAHDLRSPFFGFKGLVEIVADEEEELSDEEKKRYLNKLSRSVKEINMLLENLLDWSRLQSKQFVYNPEVFNLHEEISQTLFLLLPNAELKGIKLVNNIADSTFVIADRRMIQSVIQNLVSNAIKFTLEKGKIEVTSQSLENFVTINVIDQGIGIPAEFKDKLFKIDGQITSRGTNDEKGTGLGLIICKELIEMNGGQISFVSEETKGTTFTFTLPKAKVKI